MSDLSKDAVLAMEARYLPRILTLEVALLTAIGIVEDHVETIGFEDVRHATTRHLELLVAALNDKEYLKDVFDEEMKRKLNLTRVKEEK